MNTMNEIKDMLCNELDKLAEKRDIGMGDLEKIHKLTDTIKNIYKIEHMKETGYSMNGYDQSYRYDNGNNSYNNSYNNRGQHWVRGHYSRDDGARELTDKIRDMLNQKDLSQQDRNTLVQAIEYLK